MKCLVFFVLLNIAFAAKDIEGPPPQPPPAPPVTTPTPNTTTTIHPNTTTTAPNTTTTTSTTTIPTTTKSTTAAPTTIPTTPVPTTTVKPSPPPTPKNPDTGHWRANYTNSSESCIVLQAGVQIQIPYIPNLPNNNETYNARVDIPANATVVSGCSSTNQNITLRWNETNTIFVEFKTVNKKYELELIKVEIVPDKINFPYFNGTSPIVLIRNRSDFATGLSKSYKCFKEMSLNLTDIGTNHTGGYLHLWKTQFQAFHNSTNGQFETAEDCETFDTPDIVPLAVGCALAALVIIVLIAYLIGRKRAQARGYLSM